MRCVRVARAAVAAMVIAGLAAQPAAAQSLLRDAETEQFFRDMARPLEVAAGLDPRSVQIVLVGDNSINAFASGGQNVYLNSGLIAVADNVNQIQGVVAHELGHVAGGHLVRYNEGAGPATSIALLSLLLGAAAVAAGAGDAGMAIMGGGQTAAQGKFLAFSRDVENRADQAGALYLERSHLSGKGSIDFFKKLGNEEMRYGIPQTDSYARTHPITSERLSVLEGLYEKSAYWKVPPDPVLNARFLRIKAKLTGYVEEPARTFQLYPETDQSVPAHYARAYAWHKQAYPDKALAEADALLKIAPNDPYYNELKGQILLESGRVKQSLPPLRLAVAMAPDQPLIAATLGGALIETEDKQNTIEAKQVLKAAVARDNSNPFAWYQLGVAYERDGDEARAALASAERFSLEGASRQALPNAKRAMMGLKPGTPDYLRAQDIAMVSESDLARSKKNR